MEEIYWIWLSRIKGLGSKKIKKLLEIYRTPQEIWNAPKEELSAIEGIGEGIANEIRKEEYKKDLEKEFEWINRNQIQLIPYTSKRYPSKLKNSYHPPIVLYVKGNVEILQSFSIGVIGCRLYSEYGRRMALAFSYQLAKKGIKVISGLARGIDSFSHLGCIQAKGNTIAVIGSGLDVIYPKENLKLYQDIIQTGGAIVSEYSKGTNPEKNNFPARNRIISGLCDGLLVIEAKQRSGTLITVDFALEEGKNIFVIPGNLDSRNSNGTNRLIQEGAKLVCNITDILEEYSLGKFEY